MKKLILVLFVSPIFVLAQVKTFHSENSNITIDNSLYQKICLESDCELVYSTSFDKDDISRKNWESVDDEKQEIGFFGITGKNDSKLFITNKWERMIYTVVPVTIPTNTKNFQISFDADIWNNETPNYGLVYGFKDWDNHKGINIDRNGNYMLINTMKGMDFHSDWKDFDSRDENRWNLVGINGNIYISVNGKVIDKIEDYVLSGSELLFFVGAGDGNSVVAFDELKISIDGISTPSERSRENDAIKNKPSSSWRGNGSGVVISKTGFIVTNYHVIDNASEIEVELNYKGEIKKFNAEIIKSDITNDLSILRINDDNFKGFDSIKYNFNTRSSSIGTKVYAYGYPLALTVMGKDIKVTDGMISSKTGYAGDVTTYQITAPIQAGNSGGPLFDDKGNLIGINNAILNKDVAENVAYSIKSNYVLNLIDILPTTIDLPSYKYLQNLSLVDQIEEISKYVVLIKVK